MTGLKAAPTALEPEFSKRLASSRSAGPAVWERLWRSQPGPTRDDALLAREQQSQRWAMIVGHLEATFGSLRGLKTIELGSGRGDLSVLLAKRGARVTLFDANTTALGQAESRFNRLGLPARYLRGDLFALRAPQRGRFDVSLSSGVIEHFRGGDRTRALRAHFDALKPGGLAMVSVPNARCFPYRFWKLYLEMRGAWPYGIELPYTRGELIQRARAVGFVRTVTRGTAFWQSVGWGVRGGVLDAGMERLTKNVRRVRGMLPSSARACEGGPAASREWWERPSHLDAALGFALVLFGWRGGGLDRPAVAKPTEP